MDILVAPSRLARLTTNEARGGPSGSGRVSGFANPLSATFAVVFTTLAGALAMGLFLAGTDASAQPGGLATKGPAAKVARLPGSVIGKNDQLAAVRQSADKESANAPEGAASGTAEGAPEGPAGHAAEDPAVAPAGSAVDAAFIAARKAMVANDLEGYDKATVNIPGDHVLHGYVQYWRLRILLGAKRLEALTGEADASVRAYLNRYPDTIAADLLRRDWMLALGRRGDWPVFDEQYAQWQLRDETAPDCYAQLSRLTRLAPGRQLDAKARKEIRALLMRPVAMNRACSELFDGLAAAGALAPQEIRERMMFALEANATNDIRQTAALLGSALNEKGLEQALNRPAAALKSPQPHDLLLIALVRLARADPEVAAAQLRLAAAKLAADERRFVWSQITASGMRRLSLQCHDWAKEAVGAKVSDESRVWMARAALRERDWALLRSIILAMDAGTRGEATWTYWLGRVHKALDQPQEAQKLFASLAARHDFYGKLANEELDRRLEIPARPDSPDPALVAASDSNPGFARALAFYDLGMRFEGNREWNFQLRGRTEAQLRAVAHWAMQRRLLDRAINTDERIRGDPDFALRFPTPFAEQLIPITREQNIDAAFVYGLIRQESRFITDARSHVGASGLMQLMPATARWVARKMGRSDFSQSDLNDLQTNLEFGSFYLKQALDDLDGSAVLASAGYNAGPARARAWRSTLSGPLEGAIFAEIIPFAETRGYVKNVLSNATDYAAIFSGEPQSLKARLGTIEPKAAGVTQLP